MQKKYKDTVKFCKWYILQQLILFNGLIVCLILSQ